MEAISVLLALPFMVLNLLGGLVGGIGLLFQGEWELVLGGVGWAIVGPFLISLGMAPSMVFLPILGWAAKRESAAAMALAGIPALAWTYLLVIASCVFVFSAVVRGSDGDFFHLLWGYSTASAPWAFLARKDREAGNQDSSTLLMFMQFGLVSMMVATWIDPSDVSFERLAYWFTPFMLLGLLAQVFVSWTRVRKPWLRI